MADLLPGQWAIGEGETEVIFGDHTPIRITDFNPGDPDQTLGDVALVNEDGLAFGRDYRSGRLLSVSVVVSQDTLTEARDTWRQFQSAWSADTLRASPVGVVPLRMYVPGSQPLRVYGRPRKSAPSETKFLRHGIIQLELEFQAADHKFYAEEERVHTLSLLPDFGGGFDWPIDWPIDWGTPAAVDDVVVNGGDMGTWPVIRFTGPVSGPSTGWSMLSRSLGLSGSMTSEQWAEIDTRPWARSVLRENGGSIAGQLTGDRMADFQLPPGQTTVNFRGNDLTGNARCEIRTRDAYSTL